MDADVPIRVKWRNQYAEYDLDPTTKVGKGLCSCVGCENPCIFVVEDEVKGAFWDGAEMQQTMTRHRGLCFDHAQTQLTGYWTPGMAQVMTTTDQPAARPGRRA